MIRLRAIVDAGWCAAAKRRRDAAGQRGKASTRRKQAPGTFRSGAGRNFLLCIRGHKRVFFCGDERRERMKMRRGISATGKAAWVAAALFFGAMVMMVSAFGQGFTVEQAMNYPFPDELTAAAHGERVAWVFNVRGARNVWAADGPDFAARQVTHYSGDDGMPIASLRLTPDGNTIVYARGSETNEQGEVA